MKSQTQMFEHVAFGAAAAPDEAAIERRVGGSGFGEFSRPRDGAVYLCDDIFAAGNKCCLCGGLGLGVWVLPCEKVTTIAMRWCIGKQAPARLVGSADGAGFFAFAREHICRERAQIFNRRAGYFLVLRADIVRAWVGSKGVDTGRHCATQNKDANNSQHFLGPIFDTFHGLAAPA